MTGDPNTKLFMPPVSLPAALSVGELFLDVRGGPDGGKSFGPLVPPVRIGTAKGNDVILTDPTVSRFHCSIEPSADGQIIADGGSTNGTFLGVYRIREAHLHQGASLRLGQTEISIRISETRRALELSSLDRFGALVGGSNAMRALFATLARLASRDVPVLIEGETGTGKELVARALHSESSLRDRPFVVFDSSAVAPSLVESELFGHVRGAFTGAEAPRAGVFELADQGTVFLDEIGELPMQLQPKLLRVLETGLVKPLGGDREIAIKARVLAATHRDLRQMVNAGTFREDLYFRLAVFPIRVPPLRERLDDLALLARHFLTRALGSSASLAGAIPPRGPELTPETLAILCAQSWPGNVRELRNVVERAAITGDEEELLRGDLTRALREQISLDRKSGSAPVPLEEAKRRFEHEYLVKLLARHQNDIRAAAKEADLHPKSLARLIRRHNLRGDG